jgi:ESX secretion-associated protein EspA/E
MVKVDGQRFGEPAGGSDLLAFGQVVIAGLKNTTGQGDPERGEAFGRAQATFHGVTTELTSAIRADGWAGTGAHAYADQNTRQQLRSQAMADADREVHKVLDREAAQIVLRRGYLDDQCSLLASTRHAAARWQSSPQYGEAMTLTIELAALQTALGESCHQMKQLECEVAQNAADLLQTVGRYAGVADSAELPAAVAATLDGDNPPGPPAETPLLDGR